jgi:hypothetical protein
LKQADLPAWMLQKRNIPRKDIIVYDGVNMSVTVSVRLDEDDLKILKEMGLKPGPLMKNLLKEEIRKRKAVQALQWLEKQSIKANFDVTESIRKDRDRR